MNWQFIRQVGYIKFLYRTFIRQFFKRIFKISQNIKLPNNIVMTLPINSKFASEVFVTNCDVDWGSETLLMKYLESDKCFLDIGANIGYYSLLAASSVKKVYAFEPDPRNLEFLRHNLEKIKNTEIINQAVYSISGQMEFDLSDDLECSHIVIQNYKNTDTFVVRTTTVDDFAETELSTEVTAIKIDVEGADFDVLLGASRIIERDQPLILAEFFDISDDLLNYVADCYYKIFAFVKPSKSLLENKPIIYKQLNQKLQFLQIGFDNRDLFRYKMLFLVPPRLQDSFFQVVKDVEKTNYEIKKI